MKRTIKYYRVMWIRHDLAAGLSVFLIALPLCLGIALASGAPLYSGLMSGIIGGVVVSLLSGSHLSVSGPAAGLSTIVSAAIITLGDFPTFLLAVIIAGVFQLLLSALKLGLIVNYFPSSVIKGMLAAIGIILVLKQIPILMGYEQAHFWENHLTGLLQNNSMPGLLTSANAGTVLISGISIILLLVLQRFSFRILKSIPSPLIIVIAGVAMAYLYQAFMPGLQLKASQLVTIPDNLISHIQFPAFSKLFKSARVWETGLTIGLLASLETLLSIEAIDKLDRHNRITPVNRELFAQGIGNILCGLLGAIPITAVIVRGAANIDAGARTRFSAFTHGIFLLLAVSLIPFLLNSIPFASLAAILLLTGYNLAKPRLFRDMWNLGLKQFLPFISTILLILFTDLLIGVGIGLLISVYFIIQNNFKAEYKITESTQQGIPHHYIKLNTNVTFLNKVNLRKALDRIEEYSILTIDGSECNFIDYDILEAISEFGNKARDRHIELHLKGIQKVEIMAVH
jgi:MFS superfamily sulfate permease-like transporter